jgi:hypothetical protein
MEIQLREGATENIASSDHEVFIVEDILDFQGSPNKKPPWRFLNKWLGYDQTENTGEPWSNVRNLKSPRRFFRETNRSSTFHQVKRHINYHLALRY